MMMSVGLLRASIAAAIVLATAGHASTLTPPVLPLVIRNPYLSVWLDNAREEPWTRWPMFYEGQGVSGPPRPDVMSD